MMDRITQILKQIDWYEITRDPVTLQQIRLELLDLQKEIEKEKSPETI
jgi:hypothetical protein